MRSYRSHIPACPRTRFGLVVAFLLALTMAAIAQPRPALVPYTDGTLWGYADTLGRVRIPPQWQDVQFFANGRATVRISPPQSRPVFASIDTTGRYIIAPELGWNGLKDPRGGSNFLNVFDSAGNGGMVDMDGRVIIPRVWQWGPSSYNRLGDSMMVVYRDGLAGVIGQSGNILIPCKWGTVNSTPELRSIGAFLVGDPDNTDGANSLGVTDLQGRLLVPTRYNQIELVRLSDGGLAFNVFKQSSNELRDSWSANMEGGSRLFLSYPAGVRLPSPEFAKPSPQEERLPGGLIVTPHRIQVLDSNRNVVIPCCRFKRVKGDTLILHDEKSLGEDSLALTIEYRLVGSPRKTLARRKWMLHREKEQPGSSYRRYRYDAMIPQRFEIPDFGPVDGIYKDSLLLRTPRYLNGNGYMIVNGLRAKKPQHGSSYTAILDSQFNYVIAPLKSAEIRRFNAQSRLAVIVDYDRRPSGGETVIETDGREIMHLRRGTITEVFRSVGKLYAFIAVQDECNPEPDGMHRYMVDSTGTPLPAFSRYRIDAVVPTPGGYQLQVYDSTGRFALLNPDGTPVFEALSFRYWFLAPAVDDWLYATEIGGRKRFLVDRFNRQLLPRMNVQSLDPVSRISPQPADPRGAFAEIYRVSAIDGAGIHRVFYLDKTGRGYGSFL